MPSYDYDLGVVGGGAAGLTAAAGAAGFGARVLLVEKEDRLGGDCLHYGCVPSKTLIHSARIYHQLKDAPRYGLPRVDPPPVDFREIRKRIQQVIGAIQHHDSEERFCGTLGVAVEYGRPAFLDPHAIDLEGRALTARSWIIATGSSPSAPPLPGLAESGYLTNREIFSLDRLPGSMIVLGGGPIAVEMSQAFARLGTRVTMIQRGEQILSKEDPDLADLVLARLRAEGVTVELGCAVREVSGGEGTRTVRFRAAGEERSVSAEQLLVALGRRPNTEGLGLAEIGVGLERGAVVTDERTRTSVKNIFAAGDVNGKYQFTHAAGYEGGIALTNAVLRLPRKADYTFLPWCTYCDPELASIGLNEKAARAAGIEPRVWTEEFADNDRARAEGEGRGLIKMVLDEREKPIGVQILGPRAGDLIAEWVAVLAGRVKLSTLAGAIHPYPTLAEINKRVAGNYLSPKIFSPTLKKGLKLFFNLKGRACPLDE